MNDDPGASLDAEQLTGLRFFRGESPDALEWLLDAAERRSLTAGTVLLEPGQVNRLLYILLSGVLEVRLERDGDVISTLSRGDCAGEMSVLDSTHTSAWVSAATDCEMLVVDGVHLWTLITHSHTVAVNLLCILSERVRSDNQLIDRSQHLRSFYEYHARIDALTGLHNRRWLDSSIARFARRRDADSPPFSLIMTDIDHFKVYNDSHGHLAGDVALRSVAQEVERNLRPDDTAARYGGEEFVVLLPNTDHEAAMVVATRLCDAVRAVRIISDEGKPLPGVTLSAGVATLDGEMTPGALLAAADAALYRAKRLGRDRVCD